MGLTLELFFAILLALLPMNRASVGDLSIKFTDCVSFCQVQMCLSDNIDQSKWINAVNVSLNTFEDMVHWSCPSECKYRCMWNTVSLFTQSRDPIPQFYGKWPFVRILGVQEPVSVLASFTQLLVGWSLLRRLCKQIPPNTQFRNINIMLSMAGLNSCFWSVFFHAHDAPFTERMDYFSGLAFILTSLSVAFIRIYGHISKWHILCMLLLIGFFIRHVVYMVFVTFDYSYHLRICIIFSMVNAALWIYWIRYVCSEQQKYYTVYFPLIAAGLTITASFDIFDFPPVLWAFDAHSIFHLLSTVMLYPIYLFFLEDLKYLNQTIEFVKEV